MTISVGDRLPVATLMTAEGAVDLSTLTAGRRVVIFAVPGAYTGTCTTAHVPSFIRTKAAFDAKGVEAIYCVAVNDPYVMTAWGESTGATEAGIVMLADPAGEFATALGMTFDAAARGLINRSRRYAMAVEDGVVTVFQPEDSPGQCTVSGGEAMLEAL